MNYSVSISNSDKLYFPQGPNNSSNSSNYSNLDLFGNKAKWNEDYEENGNNSQKFLNESDAATCYGYWLASPSAGSSRYVMVVYCSGVVDCSSYGSTYYGVRPVVSLKSGVKIEWVNDSDANDDGGYYEIVGDF